MGPRERLTLRYLLTAVFFLFVTGFEGTLMAAVKAGFLRDLYPPERYYAMMTVHPYVGTFGWAYMAVMGAFYYLVPFVLKKELYSEKIAEAAYWLMTIGVVTAWSSGFFFGFASLWTIYWPLPVMRFPPLSVLVFSVGTAMIYIGVLLFFFNMFATIFLPQGARAKAGTVFRELFTTALNLDKLKASLRGAKDYIAKAENIPVFVVGVFRGCVDTYLNAIVLLGASSLLLVYAVSGLTGNMLPTSLVDPLIYKNIFWWGLDLIADGNVLIFTAATWYFLAPLLTGRKLFGENVVWNVILLDLLVSWTVWNHHMLADTPQPLALQIQGQITTYGELITMGLSIFATLMTIWYARPVKYSVPLYAMVLSILGYMLAGTAGLLQATYAINRFVHNTQWVPGFHFHTALLAGLSMTLYAAAYALLPILTGKEPDKRLSYLHLTLFFIGVIMLAWGMGVAGINGALRRYYYFNGEYQGYFMFSFLGALVAAAGFAIFLVNILKTYGLRAVVEAFKK